MSDKAAEAGLSNTETAGEHQPEEASSSQMVEVSEKKLKSVGVLHSHAQQWTGPPVQHPPSGQQPSQYPPTGQQLAQNPSPGQQLEQYPFAGQQPAQYTLQQQQSPLQQQQVNVQHAQHQQLAQYALGQNPIQDPAGQQPAQYLLGQQPAQDPHGQQRVQYSPEEYHPLPNSPAQPANSSTMKITCQPSIQSVVQTIKVVCWFALLVASAITLDEHNESSFNRYFSSSKTSPAIHMMRYLVAVSVIMFVVDAALLVMLFIGFISKLHSQSKIVILLMIWNAICIFFNYVSIRMMTWIAAGAAYGPPIVFGATAAYQIFAGFAIAACAVDIKLNLKLWKKTKTEQN